PNYLLQWEAMRWAKAHGCTRYDLWGAPDIFDESDGMWGVYQFKRGFRGTVNRLLITDKYNVQRYDMQDEVFTNAFGTENYLSINGGNDKTQYFASFGYTNNDGIIQNTNFTKYTGRLRLNQTLADWATLSAGLSYNYSLSRDLPNGNNFFSPISTMFIIDNVWDITERDAAGNLATLTR
ncbi:MAG TPA: peptidoglycan bridge formation glycyltransferase FemA/FemB family protein, partial [Saprospiraceae bacterium]|nr:peptidoglycan bridge formation glycyltransferase FemA/FemB family protein [Saprospiraceae bacterium]